jgi:lysophospholipase L1-like esterase
MIVAGDSIALGLAPYLHLQPVAKVGIGSQRGTAMILPNKDKRLVINLGTNDAPQSPRFRQRVELILQGRKQVVWLTIRGHSRYNRILRSIASKDYRLKVVNGLVPTVDGIHPTSRGYRSLALRIRHAS